MERRNPFEYGRELSREELVDREEELKEIAATIRNRGKLFLIGPRRFGKTSLLSAAEEDAIRAGTIVLRQDAEKYESLDLLAEALLSGAIRAFQGPVERAFDFLRKAAGRLQPRLTMDGESVSIILGVRGIGEEELPIVTESLDAIEGFAKASRREVVVILDEIQAIVVEHGIAAERQLRSTIQRHRHVGYIFAGSATRMLVEMTSQEDRPFYRIGTRLFVDALPREAFREFLRNGLEASGLSASEEACEAILDLSEDVPYNVQRLAHETWELAREGFPKRKAVAPEMVHLALSRIVGREDPAYTQIWTTLTSNRKKALKAVVETGGKELFSMEVVARFGVPASSLRLAVGDLEKAHLVRPLQREGSTQYRLVDPFFRAWLESVQG